MSNRQNLKKGQPPDEEPDSKTDEAPRSYYYDDSTGYETYDAEEDRDEEGCENNSPGNEN